MASDPLSDIITLSEARCTVTRVMPSRGAWHYRFDPPGLVKFVAIARGGCWLTHGGAAPLRLTEGDVFMLSASQPFAMASNLYQPVESAAGCFTAPFPDERCLDAEFLAVCGHVELHSDRGALLADALPPVALVSGADREAATMRWLLDRLIIEINAERDGSALAATELAQLLFVHLLRACIASGEPLPTGWVGALKDVRIGQALRLIHHTPEQSWRVGELASRVGMSRTSFAVRFSALVGVAPLAYLTAWRLRLAERELRTTNDAMKRIANNVGYASTTAFSAAFTRMFGTPPRRYRKRAAATANDSASAATEAGP